MEPFTAIIHCLQCREPPQQQVLPVGIEGRPGYWRILGLFDMSGLEVVLEIGKIGRFPGILPPDIVRVACSPADFVIPEGLLQKLGGSAS